MSSGFVSGGTAGEETERDDEWKNAQRQIEEARKVKEDLAKQHDGKSLFEILQANKDKKQAEFEERARFKLRNALDDEEADYLDSVLDKKRKEEIRVNKETLEQLNLFRRQQEEAEANALNSHDPETVVEDGGQWAAIGRKRKTGPKVGLFKGVKLQKTRQVSGARNTVNDTKSTLAPSQIVTTHVSATAIDKDSTETSITRKVATATASSASPPVNPSKTLSLGLGYVSSDDEA